MNEIERQFSAALDSVAIIGGISPEGHALFDLRNSPVVEEEEEIVPAI